MIYSVLVYFFTFLLTMLSFKLYLSYRDSRKKVFGIEIKYILLSLTFFFPSFIAAIRYNVGTDYQSYVSIYNNISAFSIVDFFTIYIHEYSIEPLFYIICRLVYIVNGNISLLFFIFQALTIGFYIMGILKFKFEKFNEIAILMYFLVLFPLSLNIVRQAVAIAISFYAMALFFNNEYKRSFIFMLLSSMFHYTSLICLIIYIFRLKDMKNYDKLLNLYLLMIVLTPITTYILMKLINILPIFEKYTSMYMVDIEIYLKFGYLINILPTLIFIIVFGRKEFIIENKEIVFLFLIQFFIGYLGYYLGWASRLIFYFKTIDIVLILKLCNKIHNNPNFKVKFYIIIGYFLVNYIYLYIILNQNQTYPYLTIF